MTIPEANAFRMVLDLFGHTCLSAKREPVVVLALAWYQDVRPSLNVIGPAECHHCRVRPSGVSP